MLTHIAGLAVCDSLVRDPDRGRLPQVQGRPLGPLRGLVRVQIEGAKLVKVILLGAVESLDPLIPLLYGPALVQFLR